ncbi:hypothetical protein LTR37_010980 [Vermiconidia calcicola]|uniref:Uncharacterized protein n=1 Tax=Vermiconidia calcicola TaxID=1690605 RepID=A0ACC3N377_9PEZI|nr:hypothetical protein LTR37_010980 [Vermiconidia calcicola]
MSSFPTRKEIDRAHAKGDWLDIGIPSVRNIMGKGLMEAGSLMVLASSSKPIHLLYNSVVFKAVDSNRYYALLVNEGFLEDKRLSLAGTPDCRHWSEECSAIERVQRTFARNLGDTSLAQRLEPEECTVKYGVQHLSGRSDLLLITGDHGQAHAANNTEYYTRYGGTDWGTIHGGLPFQWICGRYLTMATCDIQSVKQNASKWTLEGRKIHYCLSQLEKRRHCKLQFSLGILAAVIAMNFSKCASLFYTYWVERHQPLVTVGDALARFLDNPDELTKGRCLMSRFDVSRGPLLWRPVETGLPCAKPPAPTHYAPALRHWSAAATQTRWFVTMGLSTCVLTAAAALLGDGASDISKAYDL